MRITEPKRLRLAVLASGRGSNFIALLEAIKQGKLNADICILISDKQNAPALNKAEAEGIPAFFIDPHLFKNRSEYEQKILEKLQATSIDIVVLAGYMRLVGTVILNAYKMKIVNIHPALLPSFPGLHAQKQAVDYGVKYSGCTVHFVDEGMDTGPIIMQSVVPVFASDTEDTLAERILAEEHKTYCQALQLIAQGLVHIDGHKVHIS